MHNPLDKYYTIVNVTLIPLDLRRKIREDYKRRHLSLTPPAMKASYNTHHIIPVALGGTNERKNLVLMNQEEHVWLHQEIIDPQVENMEIGESKYIMLPRAYQLSCKNFKTFLKIFDNIKENER